MLKKSFRSILILSVLAFGAPLSLVSSASANLAGQETPLDPAGAAYEVNPDRDGNLWVSDNTAGEIRAYAPDGSSVSIYSGLGAVSDARAAPNGLVWYVDQENRRLERLDPSAKNQVFWQLPPGGNSGFGTAFDQLGRVWVSDFNQSMLFRFDPVSNQMCSLDTSALAIGGSPYLVPEDGWLWLSDFYGNAVLKINPLNNQLTRWQMVSIDWDFEAEGLDGDGAGGLWFADANTNSLGRLDLSDPGGSRLLRYQLPAGSGKPHMLVSQDQLVWYSGLEPARLGALDPSAATPTLFTPEVSQTTLTPVCETRSPSVPQAVSVSDQTPTWNPADYQVTAQPGGWQVITLGMDSYPWGLALQDGYLWTVDNGQQAFIRISLERTLTACKLADEDGDLATMDDQSPVDGWGMTLYVDGQRFGILPTGGDGCASWDSMTIGHTYQVTEETRQGWQPLDSTQCDLGVLVFTGEHTCQFVNTPGNILIYLPLVVR
jgi:streptogramin lyase